MKKQQEYNISVCLATYNGELYIKEQLESILNQLSKSDEVIISDDNSTDATIEIINSFKDDRIFLYENKKEQSLVLNFENTLNKAKNNYIFLADQDDIWKPNKVTVMKKLLYSYDLIVSAMTIIDSHGNIIEQELYKKTELRKGLLVNIIKNSYQGATMAFNKKILDRALPFPKDIPMHDWWIGLIAELYGTTYICEETLISYRRHKANASTSTHKSKFTIYKKIYMRYIMLKNLFNRYMSSNEN